MLARIVAELGPWSWWIVGLVLLAAEMIVPGFFLVWIGLAALAIGVLSLLFWDAAFWVWETQLILFAVLAVAATLLGRRLTLRHNVTDEPFLNQRGASLVGRTATLSEPIAEGRGRIRLDDTIWRVTGPNLPAGTQVKVVASNGRDLTVEPL
ncbi:NfeD family protein [Rhizobium sullae]|uniref:NfeD family protein n=1 Tax=Rhizobium sullae TaxID=50338 RepID=A0A2N0D6G8_RHISU|nr:NfeD family protein [Rhizobium sullae]PKA41700.1 NfeD family protein [Rhizobium sullae]UWU13403.1 NfeD family protein [Rhizobium sullae]